MINGLIKFFFGKEVAIALKLLKTGFKIFESISAGFRPNVAPFAREVFKHLPTDFKAPNGPATEQEFVDALYNVFALFTKSKK